MNTRLAKLLKLKIEYTRGDNCRIHHMLKVHDLAVLIGSLEDLDTEAMTILSSASIIQEEASEGRMLMKRTGGFSEHEITQAAYLVEHFHDNKSIKNIAHQILIEAELLVNIFEYKLSQDAITKIREDIFKTMTGRRLLDAMYGGTPWASAPQKDKCASHC